MAYALLLGLSSLFVGIFLWNAHQRAWEIAESRLEFSSALIAEWISSAFVASDYLLRDMAAQIDPEELLYPHPDAKAQAELSERLDQRRRTFPHAVLFGAFDRNCIVTHGNAILGFDASDREYCLRLRLNPELSSVVTHGYRANVGPVNVTHARALRSEDGEFLGLVAIALDTELFSDWLTSMGTGQVDTLAIVDLQQMLLARHPPLPAAVGQKTDNPDIVDFIRSDQMFRVVVIPSPLDQKVRYFGARKIEGLPFGIVVGMERSSWLSEWQQLLVLGLSAWLLVAILGWLALRSHLRLMDGRLELQRQARSDPLTEIPNRAYFTDQAEKQLARARRTGDWVSLLLLDVDRFKAINDAHGHLVGDRALKAFAATCEEVTRTEDIVGRWGGDEFAVLIAQDRKAAVGMADRLQTSIRNTRIASDAGQPVSLDTSIGIASMQLPETLDLDELTRRADWAMLDAKRSGRGCIRVFGEHVPDGD